MIYFLIFVGRGKGKWRETTNRFMNISRFGTTLNNFDT